VSAARTTVIVPTHDRATLLPQTLASLRGQVGEQPEIVVVDDGSQVPASVPDGVRLVRLESSRGAATARNVALGLVQTPWVAFCDDDDLWAPTKLADQHAALQREPDAAWSYTAAVEVDEHLGVLGGQRALDSGWIEQRMLQDNKVSGGGSTVLARTDLVREAGGFAPDVLAAEDWDLWVRLARRSAVVALDRPLVAWRRHASNKSGAWPQAALDRLDERLGSRAGELGAHFEHGYARQARIDRLVAAGRRHESAAAYWDRYRAHRSTHDAVAAAAVLVAPRAYGWLKRRQHRRSVPPEWESQLSWLDLSWLDEPPVG
jgi:glycosyltransferase involved in cell wall biosynthesis